MREFTEDWFSHNIANIEAVLARIPKPKKILEIGSFEGRSACWFLESVLDDDGKLCCIDNFGGSLEHTEFNFNDIKRRFLLNTGQAKKGSQTLHLIEKDSVKGLAELISHNASFDFIYVDGSHTSPDTLTDACMAFQLLKSNGVMIFDDYLWEMHTGVIRSPKAGIDVFTMLFSEQCKVILNGYQVGILKY
jgi:predicted O-methyltransferase YrrM